MRFFLAELSSGKVGFGDGIDFQGASGMGEIVEFVKISFDSRLLFPFDLREANALHLVFHGGTHGIIDAPDLEGMVGIVLCGIGLVVGERAFLVLSHGTDIVVKEGTYGIGKATGQKIFPEAPKDCSVYGIGKGLVFLKAFPEIGDDIRSDFPCPKELLKIHRIHANLLDASHRDEDGLHRNAQKGSASYESAAPFFPQGLGKGNEMRIGPDPGKRWCLPSILFSHRWQRLEGRSPGRSVCPGTALGQGNPFADRFR